MGDRAEFTGARGGRLLFAVAVAVCVFLLAQSVSVARPSKRELQEAQAELDRLNARLSVLVEKYDQARLELDRTEAELAGRRAAARRAGAEAEAARTALSARAREAYTGTASSLSLLLGAGTFGEFSDRLEFLNELAAGDAELAAHAERAGQQARWRAAELRDSVAEHQALLTQLQRQEAEIRAAIDRQESLVARVERALRRPVIVQPPPSQPTGSDDGTTAPPPEPPPPPDEGGPPPPAPSSGAAAAIAAARDAVGVRYQWGGSSPQSGFDCSGLTMWAWSHGGVSLPHSSAAQYGALPHVDRSDLQPGDLVFFYSPIHHVGLYIGGGMMIDASSWGGKVVLRGVYWEHYVGAARPG